MRHLNNFKIFSENKCLFCTKKKTKKPKRILIYQKNYMKNLNIPEKYKNKTNYLQKVLQHLH